MVTRLTQEEMDEEVKQAANKMMRSAAFGQIIILIVYLPILSLVGIEGKMFKPMAQTVAFAIIGALLLSLTYVPMISSVLLSKKTGHKRNISDRFMELLHNLYEPTVARALQHRVKVVAAAVLMFVASVLVFLSLGGEFIPTLDEGDFAVDTRVITGSSLSQSVAATQQAARVLLDHFPEVKEVVTKTGTSEIPTDPMSIEASDLMVVLKERKQWTSATSRDELAEKMQAVLEEKVPGVSFGFQQPIQMRFNELMTGARQDVVVKIYGEDLNLLAEYADQLGRIANSVPGAVDVFVEPIGGLRQIVVRYHRDRIARFGLSVEKINQTINAAFSGALAGQVFENEKRFDLVVRLAGEQRKNIEQVRQLYVAAPNGQQIPLHQLAEIVLEEGPNQIQRDDAKRRVVVGFNVRGRDVQNIVTEIQAKLRNELRMEPGYYITFGGSFKNLEEAKQRLMVAVPVALALIFLLLFFTFHSLRQGLLIYTAIPLSAIGGVFALWIRDMPFSISAGVGFIALFGVAVLNGIVLIAEFNRLKQAGVTDVFDIVRQGTALRLRPVLMTALVASLGFLPMALSETSGAEVQRPLATVVIGGLISATLLTLVVLPVLYTYFEKKTDPH
jgi:cobalt-zinc-cadmium resistance protein CzcA